MEFRPRRSIAAALLLLILLATAACAVNPVSGQRELMLLSEAEEVSLGRKTDRSVVQQYGVYEDSGLNEYLRDLCRRLGRLSHRPGLAYEFKTLDSPVVNAFAVPGGYVYFTRGILAALNSEAELAGVLGHEIGHITARHSAQQYSRAQLAQVGLGVGMLLSETVRNYADLAGFGVKMLFLRFSRENEREADDLGVQYASRAGYDAARLARFFETLERLRPEKGDSGLPAWFSTHPNPEDRQGAVTRLADQWRRKLGIKDPQIGRETYLRRIDGLIYGADPRQGYLEKGVFYHPRLTFEFPVPGGWKLENTRAAVVMADPRKKGMLLLTLSSDSSAEATARAFIKRNRAAVLESRRSPISGLPAYHLVSQIKTQNGVLQARSAFIEKDAKVYIFHGFTSAAAFRNYRAEFEHAIGGFKTLRDPEKINVRPARIRVKAARSGGPLGSVLRAMGAAPESLKELAVLNGRQPDENVPAGTLLKLLQK